MTLVLRGRVVYETDRKPHAFVAVAQGRDPAEMTDKDRLIPLNEVMRRLGYKRTTIYAMIKAGKFPKPIRVFDGPRSSRWLESEIDARIAAAVAARNLCS